MKTLKKGDKFGKLTVQEWNQDKKLWICLCDCGEITGARSYSLKNGRHKQCKKCWSGPRLKTRLPNNLGLKRDFYRQYQNSAKKRNYEFSLSEKEFFDLIEKNCFYCNSIPSQKWMSGHNYTGNRTALFNGIDRIDNSIGYVKNNCTTCCSICNNSKSILTVQEWKDWIIRVYNKTIDLSN